MRNELLPDESVGRAIDDITRSASDAMAANIESFLREHYRPGMERTHSQIHGPLERMGDGLRFGHFVAIVPNEFCHMGMPITRQICEERGWPFGTIAVSVE